MGFSRIQRATLVEAYFANKSYKKCVKVLQVRFPDSVKPSKSTVYDVIERFRETGGVNDKKRNRKAQNSDINVCGRCQRTFTATDSVRSPSSEGQAIG
jgi:transposase